MQIIPHTWTHTTLSTRAGRRRRQPGMRSHRKIRRAARRAQTGPSMKTTRPKSAASRPALASPRARRAASRRASRPSRMPSPPFAAGRMIIVVDDEDRENEGDLTMAAEKVTPEAINFMITHGRGLICLAMTPERLDELEIPLVVSDNSSRRETPFCVSIDAQEVRRTGISAPRSGADDSRRPSIRRRSPRDLARPGHVFPLRARSGGVLVRAGHTEAAVDLARIAGLDPGRRHLRGHEEGRHAWRACRTSQAFARRHKLPIITIADLIRYRMRTERLVQRVARREAADRPRRVHGPRLREPARPRDARRARARRHRRRRTAAGARALEVPDRRRLPLGALRLRRRSSTRPWSASRGRGAACCCI